MKSLLHIFLTLISIWLIASAAPGSFPGRKLASAHVDPITIDSLPADTVPADTIPADTVPADTIPPDTVPADTVPADTMPIGPDGLPVHPEWPHTMASRTIPLMHINTAGYAPILDKINYLQASCHIEVPDSQSRWEAFGSVDEPVELEIRGRGNHTWFNLPKKSYKLKFAKKQSPLGMPKHKHYALICYDPFYTSMWLAPLVGMEVSRLVQPEWVPRMQPVEVVLNGEYRGLYLFVESIKADENRLDITLQEEESEDPATISSGWIVELDNQYDEFQIQIPAQNSKGILRVTHKDPEVLSVMQRDWLIEEFTMLNDLIENPEAHPDDSWTEHFDMPSIARYMVIRELLHDLDGYSGSQYFYRDTGSDKWTAGPMWDLEFWPDPKPAWICDYSRWSLLNWIPFMMKHPALNDAFVQEWDRFYNGNYEQIFDFIDDIAATYREADLANTARWPEEFYTLDDKLAQVRYNLRYNSAWIDAHKMWGQIIVGVNEFRTDNSSSPRIILEEGMLRVISASTAKLEAMTPDGTPLLQQRVPAGVYKLDLRELRSGQSPMPAIIKVIPDDTSAEPTAIKCII